MKKREYLTRYVALAVVFVLVCLFYVGKLINYQVAGQDYYTMTQAGRTYTRTRPIQALRGQIYDANGKPLVTNKYSYSVNLDAGSIPRNNTEKNNFLLGLLGKYAALGGTWTPPDCAFIPDFSSGIPTASWNEAYIRRADGSFSVYAQRLFKIIDELTEKERDPATAPDAADSFALILRRYSLTYTEGSGKSKKTLLTYEDNEDTATLLALRLDMELNNFSAASPYLMFSDADIELITALTEGSSRGIYIQTGIERVFNFPGYASHILGRVGKIRAEDAEYYTEQGYPLDAIVGISGAEKAFESYLRGIDGELTIVEDADGNIISEAVTKEPVAGKDVYLTIDMDYQKLAEDALDANIAHIRAIATPAENDPDGSDANAGALTVMNVKTGAVIALVSNPTFDLSTFDEDYEELRKDERSPMFNRAINGTYAPGSTFKVGVAAAALTEGTIDSSTQIECTGIYQYYAESNFTPSCWIHLMYRSQHGWLDVSSAIRVSCNCFFYETGRRLGITQMNRYCRAYGLGQKTGIELDESLGVLAGPEYREENGLGQWSPGDVVQAAIGQSDNLFTPLQISCYTSTIVNGGKRNAAHILSEVRDHASGEVIYTYEPTVTDEIKLDEASVSLVLSAMRDVTEDTTGSASRLFSNYPLSIGGKTGTAQVVSTKSPNAVFTAFAPFDDPEIVATTVIEQGNAGTDAGFAVRDIFTKYFGIQYADDYDTFRNSYLTEQGKEPFVMPADPEPGSADSDPGATDPDPGAGAGNPDGNSQGGDNAN